jgi:hypothetical protein
MGESSTYKKQINNPQNTEREKHGRESRGTLNQERLCWQGPAAVYPTDGQKHEIKINKQINVLYKILGFLSGD